MILLISVCKEKMHELEFVKPVEQILKNCSMKYVMRHYKEIIKEDLSADKIIICGTSLDDNEFANNLEYFEFIKSCNKPILGICAGMQIIGLLLGMKLKKKKEIGLAKIDFKEDFLGIRGEKEVYELHNYYADFLESGDFRISAKNPISQAVKHNKKEIYGVLFHPEVRNKEIIEKFCMQ